MSKTLGHHTVIQFDFNAREICFCRRKVGPLVIPTSEFSFTSLALGIFTAESETMK